MIQKLVIIRNSVKEGKKGSETRLPQLFPRCCDTVDCYFSKFSQTSIRRRDTNLTSNQTTVNISRMLGYRCSSKFSTLRSETLRKPDCRKYYPDAVVQKLNIIRNSAKECKKKRSETGLPYLFPGCCDTVVCYYSKFSHTTIRMRETNLT